MKLIRLFITIFFLLNGMTGISQDWQGIFHTASSGIVNITDNHFDENTNKYLVTGRFTDTLFFETGDTLVCDGPGAIFIASFDQDYNPLWIYEIDGDGYELVPFLDVDKLGNIYLTGVFTSANCSFGNDTILSSDGIGDNFLAKFNNNGSLLWVNHIGRGESFQIGGKIMIDNESNIIATLDYQDSIIVADKNQDTLLYSGPNSSSATVAVKLDSSGVIYDNAIYNMQTDGDNGAANIFEIREYEGNYYFSGRFRDTVTFKSGVYDSQNDSYDIFLHKVSSDLNNDLWIKRTYGSENDFPGSITNDRHGNIYLTGFINSTDFKADSADNLNSDVIINHGNRDIFILKYNRNGSMQWGKSYGSSANDWSRQIVESQNILYITGYYEGDITFGDNTLNNTGLKDFFVGTFDTDGNKLRAFGLDQQGADDESGVVLDIAPDNAVYTGGYFKSSSIGIGDTTFNLNGTQDMFLGKFYSELAAAFTEKQNVSCYGGSDGELTAMPYFGVAPYTYEWIHNGDTLALTDSAATGLSAGDYTVIVSDARDSTDVISTTLTQPDSIVFDGHIEVDGVLTDTLNCYGEENGDIFINPTGGTGSYSYEWTSPEGTGVSLTSQNQTNLSSGDFNVEITDENGCIADTTYTIYDPEPVIFEGTQVSHIDNFQDGSIDLSVSGGTGDTANFGYYWDGPDPLLPADTIQDLDSLAVGGDYTAQVTDENACTFDTTVTVVDSTGFYIYFKSEDVTDVSDVGCYGDSVGSAIVTIVESSGNLNYTWTDSTGTDLGVNDSTITNLPAGKYNVTVEDLNKDTSLTESVIIDQPEPVELTLTSATTDTLTCNGDANGVIDLEVSGGTTSYSYDWSNDSTSQDITKLTAGSYSVTVTDANGCSNDTSKTIYQPEPLEPNVSIDSEPSCYGENDGVLISDPNGGNGGPFSFQWNDPANQTTQTADGLEAGYYTVKVQDSEGCEAESGIALTQPDSLQINGNIFDVDCYGGNDGAIQLEVGGGNGGYNYFWASEEGEGLVETDKNQSGLTASSYSVQLTDANGCKKNRTFEVTQPDSALTITNEESSNIETCYGDNSGYINIDAEGGTAPLNYELTLNETTVNNNSTGEFSSVEAGLYKVHVIDDNGCTDTSSEFDITQPSQIAINNVESTGISEAGAEDATITVDASGGTGSLYYTLNPDSVKTNTTGEFLNLTPGNYFVEVTDDNNCGPATTEEISIQSKSSGIHELENEYNFRMYPNPTNGEVQVSMYFEKKVDLKLEIINSLGHKVEKKSYKGTQFGWKQRISLSSLPSGLYFVKIYIDDSYSGKANLLIQ